MTGPRIGALFAGYGGLDIAASDVFGGGMAWYSEVDKGALRILGHRFPDVPNVGDVTTVKWTPDCPTCGELTALYNNDEMPEGRGYYCPTDGWFDLSIRLNDPEAERIPEPVDILTGGSPCQDLSHAGKRQGMTEGTRSNLWVAMREAIAQLRPAVVVWENVRGAYSAAADSAVELCPGCMGDGSGEPSLRALGRVLGDLSDLGYDCRWHGLRAADVGAPHGRFRVFVVATDTTTGNQGRLAHGNGEAAPVAADLGHEWPGSARDGRAGSADGDLDAVALLPTPAVNDMGDRPWANPETWDAWVEKHRERGINGNGHGKSLAIEAQRLLPTPRASDGTKGGPNRRGSSGDLMLPAAVQPGRLLPTPRSTRGGSGTETMYEIGGERIDDERPQGTVVLRSEAQWGDYAAAIARWERILGRPAPAPTMTSAKGNPQLSPVFVEWLMGLPAGWVTDVAGITRNEALKALGNGVVPQQAAAAIRTMLAWEVAA